MPFVCLFELQRLPPLVRSDLAVAAFVALPWVVIAWSNWVSSAEQRSASFWLCSVGFGLVVVVVVVAESARAAVDRRMAASPVAMLVRMIIAVLLKLLSNPIAGALARVARSDGASNHSGVTVKCQQR